VGRVTAYEVSPYLECGVGFVLLDSPEFMDSSGLSVTDRHGDACAVELVQLPFYDAEKNIPRGLEPIDGKVE
jgi:aminomethyltransferase